MSIKVVSAVTALVITAAVALAAHPAHAQAIDFEKTLGEPRPFTNLPDPWPLKNLVKEGTLTVGTTGASPPRTFIDPATGKLTGAYVDLFTKIAGDLGLEIEFVQLEWAGILPGLAAGRFDMACDGASWSAARLGSGEFLMTSPTAVNATVGMALADSGITTFDDLGDGVLGGVRGEIYFEGAMKAFPEAETIDFPGLQESLIGLANGQAQIVVLNLSNALNILENAPNRDNLVLVGPALEVFAQSLCVKATAPDLLVAVNTLLGNYRADGTLKEIVGKYQSSVAEIEMLDRIGY